MKKLPLLLLVLLAGCHKQPDEKGYIYTGATIGAVETYVDPEAEEYKNIAQTNERADNDLKLWYGSFNEKYFNYELPMDTTVGCGPHKLLESKDAQAFTTRSDSGQFIILIDEIYCYAPRHYQATLLHEMVHIKLWKDETFKDSYEHGAAFQAEIHRLLLAGAFDAYL